MVLKHFRDMQNTAFKLFNKSILYDKRNPWALDSTLDLPQRRQAQKNLHLGLALNVTKLETGPFTSTSDIMLSRLWTGRTMESQLFHFAKTGWDSLP